MRFFKSEEFNCPCCNDQHMDFDTIDMLISARVFADVPFIITSGWRCEKHNKSKKVGGKKDSSHLYGKAVDISAPNSRTKFNIVYGLIYAGFTRIGIGKTFIHADTDHNKDAKVLWLY